MITQRQVVCNSIGLLALRVVFGVFLILHGWSKAELLFAGDFDKFGDPIKMGKELSLIGIVLAEVVCAGLIILGLGTHFAAVPVVFAMGVAAFVVHGNDPWTMGAGKSKEPALLFGAAFLTLMFTGGGKLSLDALIRGRCCGTKTQ